MANLNWVPLESVSDDYADDEPSGYLVRNATTNAVIAIIDRIVLEGNSAHSRYTGEQGYAVRDINGVVLTVEPLLGGAVAFVEQRWGQ